jgi:hypothetical protein
MRIKSQKVARRKPSACHQIQPSMLQSIMAWNADSERIESLMPTCPLEHNATSRLLFGSRSLFGDIMATIIGFDVVSESAVDAEAAALCRIPVVAAERNSIPHTTLILALLPTLPFFLAIHVAVALVPAIVTESISAKYLRIHAARADQLRECVQLAVQHTVVPIP